MSKVGTLTGNIDADIDATHKPSEVVEAIRQEILNRLSLRRDQKFGTPDTCLQMFDEIVTQTQRAIARGRIDS